jgi:Tfp pilus assembly protein PilV
MRTSRSRGRQAGFTLIEALIALLVMAFGMLSLSGMQLSLSRGSDIAKQRTEAMRLAQRKIDEYRSFTSIAAAGGHTIVWDTLATGVTENVTTNATYAVTTNLGGAITDAMRPISVAVTWTDRGNQAQSITISSVISKSDPVDIGYVANPLPLNVPLKRPKNRNINIPIPALDLGGGQSSTQFANDYVIVYSNVTAGVVKICNPGVANATATQINTAIATPGSCNDVTGYIVAGYISRSASSRAWPTGINIASLTRNTAFSGQAIRCLYSDATDQNTGVVITADDGYKYYLCVVPVSTPFFWGGTLRLGGVVTTSDYLVCRYQYSEAALTANERNVQPYASVDRSMDEQNYRIVSSNSNAGSTLTGTTAPCNALNLTDSVLGTVSTGYVHQDCRSANPARATECPASSSFP